MKVPPPKSPPGSEPKLVYDKDRTKTRRTVAGAAGGMLGVDYEDSRVQDPNTVKATTGAGENVDTAGAEKLSGTARGAKESAEQRTTNLAGKEESEMILDDEDAETRDQKRKQRKHFVPRDRMTIDKDAPRLLRKRSWEEEEETPREEDPEELDLDSIAEAIASAGDQAEGGRAIVGDPRLLDPHAIRAALGTPTAYAKHCMILAECFRCSTGATRVETIAYFARLFAALGDRSFARNALGRLGPATGIVDIYPLEVIEHILLTYPGLLTRVGFGRLFTRHKLELRAGAFEQLVYPEWLKIRGFAVEGGGHVGYCFEPSTHEGEYRLRIDTPGVYRLLVSGATRSGHTVISRLDAVVLDSPEALPRVDAVRPKRDEAKVMAWPQPEPIPMDPRRALDEGPRSRSSSGGLSSGELIARQQQAHLDMDKEQAVDFVDAEPEQALDEAVEVVEEALSRAEMSLLKLAVAVSTRQEDMTTIKREEPAEETLTEEAYVPPED